MSEGGLGEVLRHPIFAGGKGRPLAEARLTDQQRLAALLQGAALLSHLDRARHCLPQGWEPARIRGNGLLRLPEAVAGRSALLHQVSLRDLVAHLFGSEEVAGRGEARKAARRLVQSWRRCLTDLDADEAVGEILAAAPFLWGERFASSRRALAAELHLAGAWKWIVAGPRRCRRRIFAATAQGEEISDLLASARAAECWQGGADRDPIQLAEEGRWRQAVAAWTRKPPQGAKDRLRFAEALYDLGQFEKALKALYGLRSAEARILRVHCQQRLGQLSAARDSIRRLEDKDLNAQQRLDLAEAATRVFANLGKKEKLREWASRALQGSRGRVRLQARLLSASVAWDLEQEERMPALLEEARGALEEPVLRWRWHSLRSLAATAARDPEAARDHLVEALRSGRRQRRAFEAGELWNELGICRANLGDLPGAERAFRHTARLLGSCEGPRKTTLALYNLAEIRVRRGRLSGVRRILEEATLENRLANNVRGGAQDAELWARLELAQGRPRAALEHCREALDRLEEHGLTWRRDELQVLAARAWGWLERPQQAAQALAGLGAEALAELEPEERPALWALAGDHRRALEAAEAGPVADLWRSLLLAEEPAPTAWEALRELDAYRSARAIYDCEIFAPGSAPPPWLRRSIRILRRTGASALAERLESRDLGPWQALESYLSDTVGVEALATLFERAGYPAASLSWQEVGGAPQVLVEGAGGAARQVVERGAGRWILSAPEIDDVLAALFSLASRDLEAPPQAAPAPRPSAGGGMIGTSPPFVAALDRVQRLAPEEVPMLILGESGTGKELLARQVHRSSQRTSRTFLAVNCAALTETLLMSELFGHARGAFTGADRDRPGVFEDADRGTVFLDEIGDLPAGAQGMLLRVLQEGEVRRVGETRPRKVDVRVVAATHHDLAAMVQDGRFRQDLYFRLKVASVTLPPLRERGRDVLLLADHFLSKRSPDATLLKIGPAARERLLTHGWPGNVRELENVMIVAPALATTDDASSGVIEPRHLELPESEETTPRADYHQQVERFRIRLVREALAAADGNQAEAARRLGLTRQALSYLVKQLKIL